MAGIAAGSTRSRRTRTGLGAELVHFAVAYRAIFGETPSSTLRRASIKTE
jgi:hypothetical protein